MSGTKWADSGAASYATIGEDLDGVSWSLFARDSSASVVVHDQHGDDHTLVERRASSRDDAKSAAEQALREMHDALAAHFAPVLRWSDSIPSTATLGPWSLSANGCDWSVSIITATERVFVAARRTERDVREFCSRRAAEAALRALGVPFRVEDES